MDQCFLDRLCFVTSREEFLALIEEIRENAKTTNPRPSIKALRSFGYQLMMSVQHPTLMEKVQKNFQLTDYAEILSLPGTRISVDYISIKLSEIQTYTHFSLELFAGLYSNWVYYGDSSFSPKEKETFTKFAKPASGGGPKPTFVNIDDRVYSLATITGGVDASLKMSFDLIAQGKIVHILSGRHGSNMLGQLVTNEGVCDPLILEADHYYKADLPSFSVNMEKQMLAGKVFVENFENKAGEVQRSRIKEILELGENHIVLLNWCVSLMGINEFTIDSLLEDPFKVSGAYFGSLKDVHERWTKYLL